MDPPRVTIHNLTSLDARLDGFHPDIGLYYELATALPQDAVLTTSETLLAAAAAEGVEMTGDDTNPAPQPPAGDDRRPWLVIVDSRGRLTRLDWLRGQPYWRDVLILCSTGTPAEHLDRLRTHHVTYLITGADHVDLSHALHQLADRFRVRTVRVDAGGILNGVLLRAGLVDEISVIVAPTLVGTDVTHPRHLVDGLEGSDTPALALTTVERLRDDHVWLRYDVRKRA